MPTHREVRSPILVYCTCGWHDAPGCALQLDYPYVLCVTCHMIGHLDLIGHHVAIKGSEIAGRHVKAMPEEPKPDRGDEEVS